MYKKFLMGGLMAFALFVSANPAFAVVVQTYVGGTTVFDTGDTTSTVIIYSDSDHTATGFRSQKNPQTGDVATFLNHEFKTEENVYDYLVSGNASEDCSALTYSACVTAIDSDDLGTGTLTFDYDQMYVAGSAGFTSVTSFSFANLIGWAGDNLKQVLGGGLGLVDGLIGWIIAIIVITVIVRLIFHGLRWLHILR